MMSCSRSKTACEMEASGQAIRDLVAASAPTPVVVMGVPTQHIPHGKPEEILSMLGLDTAGVVAEAKKHL